MILLNRPTRSGVISCVMNESALSAIHGQSAELLMSAVFKILALHSLPGTNLNTAVILNLNLHDKIKYRTYASLFST